MITEHLLSLKNWHIEISSKCTLKCPRCPRQEISEDLNNTELKLDFFKKNFPVMFIHKNMERIMFCGNDGDPIYAHDLIEVIRYFKKVKPILEITIVTNGSYKKETWWNKLGSVLNEYDIVVFSIDGYDHESNIKYRVNSDWDSIILGIKTLKNTSKCRLIWSTIAFKFNQDHLKKIENIAESLEMDQFQLVLSTKFGNNYIVNGIDELQPRNNLMKTIGEYSNKTVTFKERKVINNFSFARNIKPVNGIMPSCRIGHLGLYISAQGIFFPCCWTGTRYKSNEEWSNISKNFNLNENSLEDVLNDNFWKEDFQTYRWQECQDKCSMR